MRSPLCLRFVLPLLLSGFFLPWPVCGVAHAEVTALPPSTQVLRAGLDAFELIGGGDGRGKQQIERVAGGPVDQAIVAQTIALPRAPWELQLRQASAAPVEKGDVLLATFWARADRDGAKTVCVFERAGEPYEKSLHYPVEATQDWKEFVLPFVALDRYPTGKAGVGFQLGFGPQTIQIAGVRVVNFGPNVKLSDLPRTRASYAGREPGASWRKAAAERIEKIRKGDIVVVVKDGSGKPIPGARVEVKMTRHAFPFGSAVSAAHLLGHGPDDERYRQEVARLFNRAVTENDLKWTDWEADRHRALDAVDWLNSHGIEVRGHNLVWPNFRYLPRDLAGLRPDDLRRRIEEHITEEASALKGRLVEWDVLNEPWSEHQLQDLLGKESMIKWFALAHAADPAPKLFINDYAMVDAAPDGDPHLDEYEAQVRYLIDGGAPLDGIGFQCHYDQDTFTPPERIIAGLDRFARLNKAIEVTEFDFDTSDEPLQADATRDLMTVMFSHPAVNGIVMWGFWEGAHWRPQGAMFRKDWSLKPNGQAWMDLVFKQWWTDTAGQTDNAGRFATRAFLGNYQITARSGAKSKMVKASLTRSGAEVTVTVE